jgi:type II secretory pathway pseudopilin PulG
MQLPYNPLSLAGTLSARRGERSRAAFSIIEVLIGMGIVAFLFLALYGAFSSGFTLIQLARENLRATQVLVEKMETIRLYNWSQLTTTNFMPMTFTNYYFPPATNSSERGVAYVGRVTLSPAPVGSTYSNAIRQFTVEINWTSQGQTRSRTMTTFVSRHGIQNYRFL